MKTEEEVRRMIKRMESQRNWHEQEFAGGYDRELNLENMKRFDAKIEILKEVLE